VHPCDSKIAFPAEDAESLPLRTLDRVLQIAVSVMLVKKYLLVLHTKGGGDSKYYVCSPLPGVECSHLSNMFQLVSISIPSLPKIDADFLGLANGKWWKNSEL